jgi:nitroreductase
MSIDESKIAFLRGQRQTRSYVTAPIAPEAIDALIEVARWTGSAMNRQPWKFVVVENRELLEALSRAKSGSEWIANAGAAIVILTEGETAEANRFDAGRVAERLLLGSNAVGLAGAIVSWSTGFGEETVRELLNVPADLWIYAAVIVGEPDTSQPNAAPKPNPRKPVEELVVRNRFS